MLRLDVHLDLLAFHVNRYFIVVSATAMQRIFFKIATKAKNTKLIRLKPLCEPDTIVAEINGYNIL